MQKQKKAGCAGAEGVAGAIEKRKEGSPQRRARRTIELKPASRARGSEVEVGRSTAARPRRQQKAPRTTRGASNIEKGGAKKASLSTRSCQAGSLREKSALLYSSSKAKMQQRCVHDDGPVEPVQLLLVCVCSSGGGPGGREDVGVCKNA